MPSDWNSSLSESGGTVSRIETLVSVINTDQFQQKCDCPGLSLLVHSRMQERFFSLLVQEMSEWKGSGKRESPLP